ncbi:MAG: hypothetical protein AMXMBFR7_27360 [Planctomycetota bacterium]
MGLPLLPQVHVPEANLKHAEDEELGFGRFLERALTERGIGNPTLLGCGTDARVYEGQWTGGRTVAIRVVARFAVKRRSNAASLKNRFAAWLLCWYPPHHPNLVNRFASGTLEYPDPQSGDVLKLPYLVMERIEGRKFRDMLLDQSFPVAGIERMREVWLGILEGMAALHRYGLRHGDLSPANIILRGERWNPVVIDWRFSTHLGRHLEHDRADLQYTLREILTGTYDLARKPSEAARRTMEQYWSPWTQQAHLHTQLSEWMDLADSIAPGGALSGAGPSQVLKASRALAQRQTR